MPAYFENKRHKKITALTILNYECKLSKSKPQNQF